MSNAHCTSLDDGQCPRIYGWSRHDHLVCPDDGFDELLPVTPAGEEEHQRECPDEVGAQEHQTVSSTGRPIRLDDL